MGVTNTIGTLFLPLSSFCKDFTLPLSSCLRSNFIEQGKRQRCKNIVTAPALPGQNGITTFSES